jgi:hypothetical protein
VHSDKRMNHVMIKHERACLVNLELESLATLVIKPKLFIKFKERLLCFELRTRGELGSTAAKHRHLHSIRQWKLRSDLRLVQIRYCYISDRIYWDIYFLSKWITKRYLWPQAYSRQRSIH